MLPKSYWILLYCTLQFFVLPFQKWPPKLSQSLLFHLRKLMYIFQEMIDTERDYVKSLQYIMDVSQLSFLISIWVIVEL